MQSRKFLITFSILSVAVLTSISSASDTTFTTHRFSISFSTGWQKVRYTAANDSLLSISNDTKMAYCYITVTTSDHPPTALDLEAYRKAYAGTDSVDKVTDGTKILGDKSFTFVEYQFITTSTAFSRVRICYTNIGSNLFTTMLLYDPTKENDVVADLETALASLSLFAAPIRAWAAQPHPAWRTSVHDILGRSRPSTARTALFRMPLP